MLQADSLAVVNTSATQTTMIISVAARYPSQPKSDMVDASSDAEQFWNGISAGANLSSSIPVTRWDVDAFYAPEMTDSKMQAPQNIPVSSLDCKEISDIPCKHTIRPDALYQGCSVHTSFGYSKNCNSRGIHASSFSSVQPCACSCAGTRALATLWMQWTSLMQQHSGWQHRRRLPWTLRRASAWSRHRQALLHETCHVVRFIPFQVSQCMAALTHVCYVQGAAHVACGLCLLARAFDI